MRIISLIAIIATFPSALAAAPLAPDVGTSPYNSGNPTLSQAHKSAVETSSSLFAQGNVTAATAALQAACRYSAGTAEGCRELGTMLITIAYLLHNEGDGKGSVLAAKAALQKLNAGLLPASGNAKLRANIWMQIGFVHEHLYGTYKQAESDYTTATQLSPSTTKKASGALAHLQNIDQMLAGRIIKN